MIEAIERYYEFYGDDLKVECPVGSGTMMTLREVSTELNTRLTKLFLPCDETGERPCVKRESREHANWNNELLFHEYFHGETGEGLGASHQTGWTALVANCIDKLLNGNEA